ncbi:MAG: thiamine pyrophosphate-binding protein, partial [Chloroflexota bacterium]
MADTVRIGQYLIERLHAEGVGHMFGVPGDFILKFMAEVCASPIEMVNTSDEQGAIFAADAYGRVRGLGVACVTYMVGGLKVANGTGQAFAEESPVVVISGSPGLSERRRQKRLHHVVRDYDDQLQIFKHLTVAQAVIDNPETATREIDRVIDAAMRWRRPVYLEIPRDMVDVEVQRVPFVPGPEMVSDLDALN